MITLEALLNLIADRLITQLADYSLNPNNTVLENQQFVRDSIVKIGRESDSEAMLVYEKSTGANKQDDIGELNQLICDLNNCNYSKILKTCETEECQQNSPYTIDTVEIIIDGTIWGDDLSIQVGGASFLNSSTLDITNLIIGGENNPLNLSQFIPLGSQQENVNVDAANEYLQTTIYELLPSQRTRQQRINAFFEEYQALKGPIPNIQDYDGDGSLEVQDNYTEGHDISWAQDNPDNSLIDEQDSFITRLEIDANSKNKNKTLEALRNDINQYLKDIDQNFQAEIPDDRPDYENKSDGFLKIRNLNQGIIIRKQEGDDIGLEKLITKSEGLYFEQQDGTQYYHPHTSDTLSGIGPSYLMDGFTVTMWVRFLDKTSKGTLFNYGNPLRSYDPKGFRLETYVLNKDDMMSDGETSWGEAAGYNVDLSLAQSNLFQNSNDERFIRLVVYDHVPDAGNIDDPSFRIERKLYDSRLGIPGLPREYNFVPDFGYTDEINSVEFDYQKGNEKYLLAHTRVPIDFNEWYFIVASYNPMTDDRIPDDNNGFQTNPDYWRGNIHKSGDYTHYSGLGSKCKVEVISKSDLLRARGYKA